MPLFGAARWQAFRLDTILAILAINAVVALRLAPCAPALVGSEYLLIAHRLRLLVPASVIDIANKRQEFNNCDRVIKIQI